MANGEVPKITWEASFANTLEFGYPLDNAVAIEPEREGSSHSQAPSGERDGWSLGTDKRLRGEARHIPSATGTTPEGLPITGWDGSTGWRAFKEWALNDAVFRFFPNRGLAGFEECYLISMGEPGLEPTTGKYRVTMEIESKAGNRFTGYAA